MAFDEDRQAAAIAAEWGVDVDLLEETDWKLETIDGNDSEHYGYFVRFDNDTDPDILAQLGVAPGEHYREVSINAFNEPDYGRDDFETLENPQRPRGERQAYYIDGERFTPSQFKRLSKRRKIEAMVEWFHANYEDPAVRTPHESAEGGYQWIWGGPYDADEQLQDEFSDLADFDVIQDAVQEITSDGLYEWAPKASREDYEEPDDGEYEPPAGSLLAFANASYAGNAFVTADNTPSAGSAPVLLTTDTGAFIADENGNRLVVGQAPLNSGPVEALRREMLDRMDGLEALIRQQMHVAPNRGHNHPPELLEIEPPVSQAQFQEVMTAIDKIRSEANNPTPDQTAVVTQASVLRRFGAWLADASGNGVVGVVVTCGLTLAYQNRQALYDAVVSAADAAIAWAQHLPSLF